MSDNNSNAWMILRLEVLQAQHQADAINHRLGSFRQSEALAFAVSLEYALNQIGTGNQKSSSEVLGSVRSAAQK